MGSYTLDPAPPRISHGSPPPTPTHRRTLLLCSRHHFAPVMAPGIDHGQTRNQRRGRQAAAAAVEADVIGEKEVSRKEEEEETANRFFPSLLLSIAKFFLPHGSWRVERSEEIFLCTCYHAFTFLLSHRFRTAARRSIYCP